MYFMAAMIPTTTNANTAILITTEHITDIPIKNLNNLSNILTSLNQSTQWFFVKL